MHVADQGADRGVLGAEGQLAGRGDLQPHLVLDVGHVDAVALAQLAVRADEVLGHEEHRQALGAGAGALGPGQDQVQDVVGQVVLGAGDEALDALDVPGAVRLLDGPGPARADVRAGVGLGEHHGVAPPAGHGVLGDAPLLRGAELPQRPGERADVPVHPDRRVGPEDQLGDGPDQRPRDAGAAQLGRELQAEPLGVHEGVEGALEGLRERDRPGRGVEHRRVPVGLGEGLGHRPGGQPVDLVQDAADGVLVDVGIGLTARARPAAAASRTG